MPQMKSYCRQNLENESYNNSMEIMTRFPLIPRSENCQNNSMKCKIDIGVNKRNSKTAKPRPLSLICTKSTKNGNANTFVWINRSKSQNSFCNGIICGNQILAPKVQNECHININNGHKKTALTNLPWRPAINVEYSNITYTVSEGFPCTQKTILKGPSGKFKSGELTAIMGPSGSGKSTLMNILAGYKTTGMSGCIKVNGKERNLRNFRKFSCYIMQDDMLSSNLSVFEAMMIAANLKLGKEFDDDTKKNIIEEILEIIGLLEAINTKSNNLSGGQRKRLSIALELVNNPPVMLLDEPTSGLDSSTCFQLIKLLHSLSRGGRTIVCTIHQPSARLLNMFDSLYVLADGQCIYEGRVKNLVPFLAIHGYECPSYHNPADYAMEVACGEYGDAVPKLVQALKDHKMSSGYKDIKEMEESYVKNETNTKTASDESKTTKTIHCSIDGESFDERCVMTKPPNYKTQSPTESTVINIQCAEALMGSDGNLTATSYKSGFPTSGLTQFWILLKRSFITILRDSMLTHMRLASHIIVGAIIGMTYYDIGTDASKVSSNAGCIFFTTLFTMFTAMMPTILTFPKEMSVFVREHFNCWYSLKAFYFAKTLAELPFQIFFSSVYVTVVYYLTSQPWETDRILMFAFICVLTSLVGQSVGILIGAATNIETGVYLGPVTTIPTILFSGFFVNFKAIPFYLRWLTYISYVRYGFEGAMLSIYGMNRPKLKCTEDYCHFRNPKKFLEEMSMQNADFWTDCLALVLIFIILRIVAYIVLRLKLRLLR